MGPQSFPKITGDKAFFITRLIFFSFICQGGIIWDRGDIFNKVIDRGRHRGTSHGGIWSGCVYLPQLTSNWIHISFKKRNLKAIHVLPRSEAYKLICKSFILKARNFRKYCWNHNWLKSWKCEKLNTKQNNLNYPQTFNSCRLVTDFHQPRNAGGRWRAGWV